MKHDLSTLQHIRDSLWSALSYHLTDPELLRDHLSAALARVDHLIQDSSRPSSVDSSSFDERGPGPICKTPPAPAGSPSSCESEQAPISPLVRESAELRDIAARAFCGGKAPCRCWRRRRPAIER